MRFLLKTLLAAVVLALLAAGAFLAFLPTDRILRLAADQVRAATGRALSIDGAARPSLWPELGAEVEGVALSNPDWADGPALLTAEAAQISVAILPLLAGDVQVTGLRLIRPRLDLQIDAKGRRNWDMGGAARGGGARIGIDKATVADGAIRLRDARVGRDMALTALDADLSMADMAGPLSLRATGMLNGLPASARIALGPMGAQGGGAAREIDIQLTLSDAEASWTGIAAPGDAPTLRGTLAATAGAAGDLLRDLGLGDPGLGAASLSGDMDLGPDGISADLVARATLDRRDIRAELRLSGGADWRADGPVAVDAAVHADGASAVIVGEVRRGAQFDGRVSALGTEGILSAAWNMDGPRPALRATLTAGAADLRPWLPEGGAAKDGWSRAPIDLSALALADLDLTFAAGPVALPGAQIARIEGRAVVKDGAAALTVTRADVFGGAASGSARAAPGPNGIEASASLIAKGVALRPALIALTGRGPLSGTGDLTAEFAAGGAHMDALMHALSGKGAMDLRDGAIHGANLPALARNILAEATGAAARTRFSALTASWTIAEGDLRSKDLRLAGPLISAAGAGRIGIGARDIDFRVTPRAMASAASLFPSGGLGFPVTVRGPWRAPTVAPDLARAIPGLLEDAAGLAPGAAEAIGQGLGSVLDGARDADETAPLDALKGLLRPFQ